MCGICGYTGGGDDRMELLRRMTARITHRGPDAEGYFLDTDIAMGFRRLTVIDPKTGDQPIFNEDRSLVLTFNGEIYNYRQLRQELRAAGHTFATDGDSEVLIHGFEQWGTDLLPRLRGMFAFAIWNAAERSLFLARDPFGIKPLYYTLLPDGRLIYASEIKSILLHRDFVKKFNPSALDSYLSYQYAVPDGTFFEGVYSLPPAHWACFRDGRLKTGCYWEADFDVQEDLPLGQAVDEIDAAIADSVAAHRISDAPVGCFLSGGVDSGLIAALFGGKAAFSVGFAGGKHYNECADAAELARRLGLEHSVHLITQDEYWDVLPTVQAYMDQPMADPSCVALYFLAKLAAKRVRVILSGEGADELFGGYGIYHEPISLAAYQKLPRGFRRAAAGLVSRLPDFKGKSFLIRGSKSPEERYIGNACIFTKEEKARLLKDIPATDPAEQTASLYARCRGQDDITRMQYVDIHRWLVGDILQKADRMSMAHSLELRVPYLDRRVFGAARRLPTPYRVGGGTTKYALRLAAGRHLSKETALRPKSGFPVPIRLWLKEDRRYQEVRAAFTSPVARRFFHVDGLVELLDAHRAGKKDNSRKIWTVYMFLIWYGVYFGDCVT